MEEKSVDLSILFKTSKYRNKHGSSKWSDYIYLIIKMNKKLLIERFRLRLNRGMKRKERHYDEEINYYFKIYLTWIYGYNTLKN